jgi:hypothetical protein
MIARETGGRFAKGSSGNRKGRPRLQHSRRETPADFDEIILNVANRKVPGDADRGVEGMDLFTYNVLTLATGKAVNRVATKQWIELVQAAASRTARRKDREALEAERLARIEERDARFGNGPDF